MNHESRKTMFLVVLTVLGVAALSGCSGGDELLPGADSGGGATVDGGGGGGGGGSDGGDPGVITKQCKETQVGYTGLGGLPLHADRFEATAGADRGRMKPFSALAEEYRRVMGLAAAPNLQSSAATFAEAPARFYAEPQASAVNLFEAYQIAFRVCEGALTQATYQAAPTEATAQAECSTWARKGWSRTPSPDEINACARIAVTDSLEETLQGGVKRQTTAPRRWAYACAGVLTAAGFLSY